MVSVEARPAANLADDVSDVRVIAAERAVADYLRRMGWHVGDTRNEHGTWDFVISRGRQRFTLDVKADRIFDSSGRIVFEQRHTFRDGRWRQGWGMCPELDIVAVVGLDSWRCAFLLLPAFRELAQNGEWKSYARENHNYQTEGVVVPLTNLYTCGALFHLAVLGGADGRLRG